MAYTQITFEHPETNAIRVAPVGLSWTVFFFGFLPPLLRSDWKYAFIIFVCWFFTWGLGNLIFMFLYNRLYVEDLVADGYLVTGTTYGDINELSRRLRIRLPLMHAPASAQPGEAAAPNQQRPPEAKSAPQPWSEAQVQPHTQKSGAPSSGVPRVAQPAPPQPREDKDINPWIVEEGDEDYHR